MNYPFWDVGMGYGWLMAIISVFHVFLSHFAIGGGLYLVVSEQYARHRGDFFRLQFLERVSKFFVLATLVAGALTGVGIWFIIGLLNPAATEVLIHNFVWGWATEWTFFVVEILAAILYLYGWKSMTARNHLILGWIYFVAAWLSLFIINGIITFMLTPGEWLTTGNFWDGFFNPTFWPSLVFRTGVCVMLAGIFTAMIASRLKPDNEKASLVRYNAWWGLAGLALMVPSLYWYWQTIPSGITTRAMEAMPTPITSILLAFWLAAGLILLLILFGLILPRRMTFAAGIALTALALVWFGEFEWFRESVRKPYVISGYMYGNGVELAEIEAYKTDGLLAHMPYRTGNDGADLFRRGCRSCHTINGYKPLKPAFDGTDPEFIGGMLGGANVIKGNMPAFCGTEREMKLLAEYIYEQVDHRHLSEIYSLTGVALGEKVYEVRCGRCHEIGGYGDKSATLVGQDEDYYNLVLDMAGDLAPEMPAFTGDDTERAALIKYLLSLKTEDGGA